MLRVEAGVPLFLGQHLARLTRSADAVGPHARALFEAYATHVDADVSARRGGVATGRH